MEQVKYITRIAPSPTGDMHIGTARTAYFNWLAARATQGEFILRVDDTDANRHNEDSVEVIYQTMQWLGLDFDKHFRQSSRAEKYNEVANLLVKNGFAATLENGAVGLVWNKDTMPRVWHDNIAGQMTISDTNIDQINKTILIKGDGTATYQFASVVDDWFYDVNYIIRGVDHISNTPKQAAIWWAINQVLLVNKPLPRFAHIGLIHKDKKKLSKRDGAASMLNYRDAGYNSDAVLNYMLRMGWGPKVDDKTNAIMERDRAIAMFLNDGNLRSTPANFDQAKLDWFDRVYKSRVKAAARIGSVS